MNTRLRVLDNCCPPVTAAISDADAVDLERLFRSLGDRHRVKILSILARAGGEAICVCDFVDALGLAQPTVSYHLKQLGDVGLLERERRGTFAYYRLAPGALARVRRVLDEPHVSKRRLGGGRARPPRAEAGGRRG